MNLLADISSEDLRSCANTIACAIIIGCCILGLAYALLQKHK